MNLAPLPLLPFVSRLLDRDALRDVAILACQHVLGTQLNWHDELAALGLETNRFFLLGKSYSTNRAVYDLFAQRGVDIAPQSVAYDSHRSFDEQFSEGIEEFLVRTVQVLSGQSLARIIVVDCGGQLLAAASRHLAPLGVPMVGVEQTSSGHRYFEAWIERHSLIDVARSATKTMEAPPLAEFAVRELERRLGVLPRNILVVGQGTIGRALKVEFSRRTSTKAHDCVRALSEFAGDEPIDTRSFDLIIGATGATSLHAASFIARERPLVLASVSSSDREFAAHELRRLVPPCDDPHEDVTVGNVTLINGGFPLNFHGGVESLPPAHAQLVVALMLAGVGQAAQERDAPGIVPLDEGLQQNLVTEYERLRRT